MDSSTRDSWPLNEPLRQPGRATAEAESIAAAYVAAKQALEVARAEEAAAREALVELSAGSDMNVASVTVRWHARKGHVDYSTVPELRDVDLEQYRKPETLVARISVTA